MKRHSSRWNYSLNKTDHHRTIKICAIKKFYIYNTLFRLTYFDPLRWLHVQMMFFYNHHLYVIILVFDPSNSNGSWVIQLLQSHPYWKLRSYILWIIYHVYVLVILNICNNFQYKWHLALYFNLLYCYLVPSTNTKNSDHYSTWNSDHYSIYLQCHSNIIWYFTGASRS